MAVFICNIYKWFTMVWRSYRDVGIDAKVRNTLKEVAFGTPAAFYPSSLHII